MNSYYEQYIDIDEDLLDADEPVSSYRTHTLQSNVQHLIDSAVQYRVNWMAPVGENGFGTSVTDQTENIRTAFCAWEFGITLNNPFRPPNFDILAWADFDGHGFSAGSATVTAAITAHGHLLGLGGPLATASWRHRETVTYGSVSNPVIDQRVEWDAGTFVHFSDAAQKPVRTFDTDADRTIKWSRFRLEVSVIIDPDDITWSASEPEFFADCLGVQCREF